ISWARAFATPAWAWVTCAWKSPLSSRASTSPLFTYAPSLTPRYARRPGTLADTGARVRATAEPFAVTAVPAPPPAAAASCGLDPDVHESRLRQEALVVLLLQRAGHAPHPELHALAHGGGNLAADHHIRHSEPAAGLENAEGFVQHPTLVGGEVDDAVRDDHVHRCVRQRDVLDLPFQELDVRDARLALVRSCQRNHLIGHVEAVGLPVRPHAAGG